MISDFEAMQAALAEARLAAEAGEVPIGAVVVRGEAIVARGQNRVLRDVDPTAHAEIVALRAAAAALSNYRLNGCTLYVTLEPCPMCAGALVMTKCTNLVYGARDAKAGACHSLFHITDDDRLNHRVKVTGGVMADDAKFLLAEFFRNLRKEKR